MKLIWIYLLFLFAATSPHLCATTQKTINIQPIELDSVTVKMINPTAMGFGDICYDREHFEIVFDFYKKNKDLGVDVYESHLTSFNEITMFISMLNSSEPLEASMIDVYPSQVKTMPNIDWLKPLHNHPEITNDPVETRCKITIYKHSGETIDAYLSPTTIDIFDYRYTNQVLCGWLIIYGMNADSFFSR